MRNPALNLIMDCFMFAMTIGLALYSALRISQGSIFLWFGLGASLIVGFLLWIQIYQDLDVIKKMEKEMGIEEKIE